MKKKFRVALLVLLTAVFLGSLAMLLYRNEEYKQGEEIYAEAETLVELPDLSELPPQSPAQTEDEVVAEEIPAEVKPVYVDPYADALRNMDFSALREVNPDVLGWIVIPGTVLSYPIVQGEDNDYYLNHTWKKWSSVVGAIFMEQYNHPDFSDFNTLIYGHRMNNGSMFASLKHYKKQSYWQAHPYVYVTDDAGSHTYEIFSAYEVSTQGETYRLAFADTAAKQAFLDECQSLSVIKTGVIPKVYDRVLTLSTCTGNGHATRWVVQAVERGVAPADAPTETPTEAAIGAPTEAPAESTTEAAAQPPVGNSTEAPTEMPAGTSEN